MALKAKLTKAEFDALAKPLQEHYKASGDDYVLDAEGVEDVSGLKSALEKEKEKRRELAAEITKFKDLDPEKAREALAKLNDLDNDKMKAEGEYERLIAKRQAEFDKAKSDLEAKLQETTAELSKHRLTAPVKDAALKAGILPKLVDDVVRLNANRFKLNDKGNIQVLDGDGDPLGTSLDDFWGKDYKSERPEFFAASGAGGSGAPVHSNGGGASKSMTRAQFNELAPTAQMAYSKEVTSGAATLTD